MFAALPSSAKLSEALGQSFMAENRPGGGAGVPANNLRELIALAKAQPGKFNYASSGPGTPYHMAGVTLLGGQVEMMFDAISTMMAQARAGKVKALATTGKTRSSVTPAIPTVADETPGRVPAAAWESESAVAAQNGRRQGCGERGAFPRLGRSKFHCRRRSTRRRRRRSEYRALTSSPK